MCFFILSFNKFRKGMREGVASWLAAFHREATLLACLLTNRSGVKRAALQCYLADCFQTASSFRGCITHRIEIRITLFIHTRHGFVKRNSETL